MAGYLVGRGANINGIPGYAAKTAMDVVPGPDARRQLLVAWLRGHGAAAAEPAT
jgi:uncharacterized protein